MYFKSVRIVEAQYMLEERGKHSKHLLKLPFCSQLINFLKTFENISIHIL